MKKFCMAIVAAASLTACTQSRETFEAPDIKRPVARDFRVENSSESVVRIDPSNPAAFTSANGEPCLKKSSDTIICNAAEPGIRVSDVISGTI